MNNIKDINILKKSEILRENYKTKMEELVDKLHEFLEDRLFQWEDQESKVKELIDEHQRDTMLDDLHSEVKSRVALQIKKIGDLALAKGPLIHQKLLDNNPNVVGQLRENMGSGVLSNFISQDWNSLPTTRGRFDQNRMGEAIVEAHDKVNTNTTRLDTYKRQLDRTEQIALSEAFHNAEKCCRIFKKRLRMGTQKRSRQT